MEIEPHLDGLGVDVKVNLEVAVCKATTGDLCTIRREGDVYSVSLMSPPRVKSPSCLRREDRVEVDILREPRLVSIFTMLDMLAIGTHGVVHAQDDP